MLWRVVLWVVALSIKVVSSTGVRSLIERKCRGEDLLPVLVLRLRSCFCRGRKARTVRLNVAMFKVKWYREELVLCSTEQVCSST